METSASRITILAAYHGQKKIINKLFRENAEKYPHLINKTESGDFVQVQTIDMYQGDENDFVIISLTRGNPDGQIGFLDTLNRRCVAQSRAKCGMYFVGNVKTFSVSSNTKRQEKSVWNHMVDGMKEQGCISNEIEIQCSKHKESMRKKALHAKDLMEYVSNPKTLCNLNCGDLFPVQGTRSCLCQVLQPTP